MKASILEFCGRPLRCAMLSGAWLVSAGCSGGEDSVDISSVRAELIYDSDDRVEADVSDYSTIARSSVALIPPESLRAEGDRVGLLGPSAEQAFDLCSDEMFLEQPSIAKCSGVLVGDDLVLTAGHCFESDHDCGRYAYVFDYQGIQTAAAAVLSSSAVYGCRKIVARAVPSDSSAPWNDFAVIQLDRPARDRTPVTISEQPWRSGQKAVVIGYPLGLPAKVDLGAELGAFVEGRYALIMSDTYIGSSGSPAFDDAGALMGVVVAGRQDFESVDDSGCLRSRTATQAEDHGELLASPGFAIAALCATGFPHARLCGGEARCGDDWCTAGETASCAQDCPEALCTGLDCPGELDGEDATVTREDAQQPVGCAVLAGTNEGPWPACLSAAFLVAFV